MPVHKRRPFWLAAVTAISMVLPLLVGLVLTASPAKADVLPSGFATTQLGHGLNNPTAMTLTPDGRILVAEQGGKLRVIKNGALLSTAALTLTVNRTSESGFDGITIDPNFATNQYVYVYYTATTPNPHNRVSRFTMSGDTVDPSTELVLLDIDDLTGFQHNGGALHFGPDGYLYVAVGDNYTPTNGQDLTTLKGKLLRIASDGTIPTDNPFYNTNTGKYRAIWAYGLRNPYTFDFQPGTGRMFIDDVGETSFEEINDGKA